MISGNQLLLHDSLASLFLPSSLKQSTQWQASTGSFKKTAHLSCSGGLFFLDHKPSPVPNSSMMFPDPGCPGEGWPPPRRAALYQIWFCSGLHVPFVSSYSTPCRTESILCTTYITEEDWWKIHCIFHSPISVSLLLSFFFPPHKWQYMTHDFNSPWIDLRAWWN